MPWGAITVLIAWFAGSAVLAHLFAKHLLRTAQDRESEFVDRTAAGVQFLDHGQSHTLSEERNHV